MNYDLIIAGGGPAGLMAAKTAAEDGLKVCLIERKKNIIEINRICGQFTNISLTNVGGFLKYGYTEPISLEVGTHGNRIHFQNLGISLEYQGPIRPYLNYVYVSPGGNLVYREKNRLFGFFSDKETLLKGILYSVEKAGVDVLADTLVLGAENTPDGVTFNIKNKHGEGKLHARRAMAADGTGSLVVESLGMNEKRKVLSNASGRLLGYIVQGVEAELRLNTWVNLSIPELNPAGNFWMYMLDDDKNIIGGGARGERSPAENIDALMKLPAFAPWFRNAKIIRRIGMAMASPTYAPIMEPAEGNVLAIGDAACLVEVTNPGAIACGYMGAKATLKEMDGRKGYEEYFKWWQKSFDTNDPDYLKYAGRNFIINMLCTNEEVDYLYELVGDQRGVPSILVAQNMQRIKTDRPDLYAKLEKTGLAKEVAGMQVDLADILGEKQEQ